MWSLIIVFSVWFVRYSKIPATAHKLKNLFWKTDRFRPFDCEKCVSFWLALAYYYNDNWFDLLLIAGSISMGTIMLREFLNRLKL